MKIYFSLCLLLLTVACGNNWQHTRAAIIERKRVGGDALQITYRFQAGGQQITDSFTTRNRVIAHDSLTIKYRESDPAEHAPAID